VITEAVVGGKDTEVQLTLPKFAVTTEAPAQEVAQVLGVTDIFDSVAADLSGIAGPPGYLVADQFVHQAVIEVDEGGTEAAAATAMTMVRVCACPPTYDVEFTVDRPFYFVIHDTTTNAPLFIGQVADPTV